MTLPFDPLPFAPWFLSASGAEVSILCTGPTICVTAYAGQRVYCTIRGAS